MSDTDITSNEVRVLVRVRKNRWQDKQTAQLGNPHRYSRCRERTSSFVRIRGDDADGTSDVEKNGASMEIFGVADCAGRRG
jgi:hypothetical protein